MSFLVQPSLETFASEREGDHVVPVWAELVADTETPVSAFSKLGSESPSFLFESAEINDLAGRYSFVGCGARMTLEGRSKFVRITEGEAVAEFEVLDDPFRELERRMSGYRARRYENLPGCWGGAVGYLSYDSIRWIEPTIGAPPKDEIGVPDCFFVIPEVILIFDHRARRIRIVRAVLPSDGPDDEAYALAVEKIRAVVESLSRPSGFRARVPQDAGDPQGVESNTTREEYYEMVSRAQEFIKAGDIFQIVLSQRFETPFAGDALDLYRALRFVNPSPYMFCMRCAPGFELIGSSPEVHVRLTGDLVEIRPIAGTRCRGAGPEEDAALAEELLADRKECSEHLMLVDLARNDVGRIAEFGSVEVTDFMTIERYSHVMHIVSHVRGTLAGGRNAFDVMRATFPAGTVSGAPKVRAMQIINDFEKSKRCVYSGAVGYFRFDGDSDSCIALRTVVRNNGTAFVQAGGGVVADSTPEGEYQESVNKARAALRAVALAQTLGD